MDERSKRNAAAVGSSSQQGGVPASVRQNENVAPVDNSGGVAPFEFMKSAYFVVVISLSIILGLIILIFVTRYARRQYAKGHLDNHPIKKKRKKELSSDVELLQLRSFEEVDCDPVLLSESITGQSVPEETEKTHYFRMKALDQIHDLDDCILKSCKTDNPQVVRQIVRAPRSDLKNYFRRVREPIHLDSGAPSNKLFMGGVKKKRNLRGSNNEESNNRHKSTTTHPAALTTQGPLWGTNIELTKNFRIEYDVARYGPTSFNSNRYSQYMEALNHLKQSITSQSKPAKSKRQGAATSAVPSAIGSKSFVVSDIGGSGSSRQTKISSQSSVGRGIGESVAFAASISGASMRTSQQPNQVWTPSSLAHGGKNAQHRKQQKSKLQPTLETEMVQLSPSDQSNSALSSGSRMAVGGSTNKGSAYSSSRVNTNVSPGPEVSVEESSDTDPTVERLPLLPVTGYRPSRSGGRSRQSSRRQNLQDSYNSSYDA